MPLLYILGKAKLKDGIIYSFFFGFFFFLAVIFWIIHVTVLGLAALLIYLSLYPVLFFLLGRYFFKKTLSIVTLPALWVALELLKENIWCGLSFANLGYSQYNNFYLIQIADLFGVKFISFLILAVNLLLYKTFITRKLYWKKTIFVLSLVIFCFLYSFYRLPALKDYASLNISVVQPSVLKEVKHNTELRAYIIETLKILTEKTDAGSLIIYPEAAWPEINNELDLNELKDFAKNLNRDILMGTVTLEDGKFYNAALLLAKDSPTVGIYRKIKIVPFGEYVPLRKYLSFISVLNSLGDMARGSEDKIFSYKAKRFGVLICFEDIFPLFVSRFAKKSDFLINITDDSWFGGEPQASQHLGVMVFRAIENRISIARCANTGISGWVSFRGEVHTLKNAGREVFFENILQFNLPLNNKRSLYNNWQEAFPLFCILVLFIRLRRRPRV